MDAARHVAWIGAKGGCGTTTLVANVAAALAPERSVCALDLDAGKGDLAGLLDLTPGTLVPDLLSGEFDATLLHGAAARHRAGFSVLAQPHDLSRLARPLPAEALRLVDTAAEAWSLVLLDLGSRIDEAVVAVLPHTDAVVIVATPDLLALRDVGRLRGLLERVGVPPERQHLVLNRMPRHPVVDLHEVETLMRVAVRATVADDPLTCEAAVAHAQLLREVAPAAAVTRDIDALWCRLTGVEPPRRRWWAPWAGGGV